MKHIWQCLEGSRSCTPAGRVFEAFIIVLILLNTMAVVVGSVPAVESEFGKTLRGFEVVSMVIFTLEYLARLCTCTSDPRFQKRVRGRIRFALTPLAIVDLIAIAPFYLPFLGLDLRYMRLLRVVKVLQIAKLSRYTASLHLLLRVFKNKKEELILCLGTILVILTITSALMYHVENAAQPGKFSSIPAAMWWAIMTLTTVGSGDIYPITQAGKILAAITAFLGSATFAVPTGIIAAGFIEEIQKRKNRQNRCPHCGKDLHP